MPRTQSQAAFDEDTQQEALHLLQQAQLSEDTIASPEVNTAAVPQAAIQSAPLTRYLTEKRQMLHWGSRLLMLAVFVTVLLEVAVGFSIWPVSMSLGALYATLAFSFYRKTVLRRQNTARLIQEADMLLRHRWLSWAPIVSSGMVVIFMLVMSLSVAPDLLVGDVKMALAAHFLLATVLACGALLATVQQHQQINRLRRKRKRD